MATKVCKKCSVEKNLTEFPVRFYPEREKQYTSNHCSDCERERAREKARRRTKKQRQEERSRISARRGKTYRTSEEVQAEKEEKRLMHEARTDALDAWNYWIKIRASDTWLDSFYLATGKPWQDHRLSVSGRYRTRYQNDDDFQQREKVRSQAYKHDHPEMESQWNGTQRDVAIRHDGTMKKGVAIRLLNEFKTCPYCGCDLTPDNRHLDHMDPVSKDGLHSVTNLIVCCETCNVRKGTASYYEWVRTLKPLHQKRAFEVYQKKKRFNEAA